MAGQTIIRAVKAAMEDEHEEEIYFEYESSPRQSGADCGPQSVLIVQLMHTTNAENIAGIAIKRDQVDRLRRLHKLMIIQRRYILGLEIERKKPIDVANLKFD